MKRALHLALVAGFVAFAGIRCGQADAPDVLPSEVARTEQSIVVASTAASSSTIYANTGAKVAVGSWNSCAVVGNNSALKCWGNGNLFPDGVARGGLPGTMGNALQLIDLTPYEVPKINEVAVGHATACVTRQGSDGNYTTQCWGDNTYGQLGLGDTSFRHSPVKVLPQSVPSLSGYRVVVGGDFVCRMPGNDADGVTGAVFCLGNNTYGQLGYGDTVRRGDQVSELGAAEHPVDLGTGRRAKRIVAGGHHACALLDNDKVKCWGRNDYGQLGVGDTAARGDAQNELGDELPYVDLGTGRHAKEISAGAYFSCALLDNETTKCWGWGAFLGTGKTIRFGSGAPGTTAALGDNPLWTGVQSLGGRNLTSGYYHTCITDSAGTGVTCWGNNSSGELGLGDDAIRGDDPGDFETTVPTRLANTGMTDLGTPYGAPAKVESLVAGGSSTCAVISGGPAFRQIKCWGSNGNGQLGLGDLENRGDMHYYYDPVMDWMVPVQSDEMGNNLPMVNLGSRSVAWLVDPDDPRQVPPLAVNDFHVCAILKRHPYTNMGPVKCWGSDGSGQLGLPNTDWDTDSRGDQANEMGDQLPFVDLGSGRLAKAVVVGQWHTCAILDNNEVKCWGANWWGQLGLGDTQSRGAGLNDMGANLPSVNFGSGRYALRLTAGVGHTCALLDNNEVKCWGYNARGQLGRGNTTNQLSPGTALNLGTTATVIDIQAGVNHTCALFTTTSGNAFKCWGDNSAGQLGLGDTSSRGDEPGELAAMALIPLNGDLLAAGGWNTCVGKRGPSGVGWVKCAGYNSEGQLGLGDSNNRGEHPGETWGNLPAVNLPSLEIQQLALGGSAVCAVGKDTSNGSGGHLRCWGFGEYGSLGLGDYSGWDNIGDDPSEMQFLPEVPLGLNNTIGANAVLTRGQITCAVVRATAQIKCWGSDDTGQLGLEGGTAEASLLGGDQMLGDQPGEMGDALPFVNLGSDSMEATENCYGLDDGNPCTTDACAPATNTVTHTPVTNGTSCNDGSVCTTNDVCNAGKCAGTPVSYDDGNQCTTDACDAATGVKHVFLSAGTSCSDGNACTTNDICTAAGTCAGTPVVLPPATACTEYYCSASGVVTPHYAVTSTACNADNNVCTTDTCDGNGNCVAGAQPNVEDGNPCTADQCDPFTGNPVHPPREKGSTCGTGTDECDGAGRCAAPLGPVPPSPAEVAPVLNAIGAGTVAERTEFLYDPPAGAEAIQKKPVSDPRPFEFDTKRVSSISGRVLADDSLPLANVEITIKDHSEYGYTKTRVDGAYDMVVEGGGWLVVNFSALGYFPVQRKVRLDWDKAATIDDVVLLKPTPSEVPTQVPLCTSNCNASGEMTIHIGTKAGDANGGTTRGAVLLFPASTQADVTSPNSSVQPGQPLNIATREYTRDIQTGEATALPYREAIGSGVLAMPGELPPASGYTYAVDFFDVGDLEASVKFKGGTAPIAYVDNFIGFPVGTVVPSGSYDRNAAAWKAEMSGKVIKILTASNNTVTIDATGDNVEDTQDNPSDISGSERYALFRLATQLGRFAVGATVWRVPIAHFSSYDFNWTYVVEPCDNGGPCGDDDPGSVTNNDSPEDKSNCKPGSTIRCESRVLGENIPIAGTGMELVYSSDRVPGFAAPREIHMVLPGGNHNTKGRTVTAVTSVGSRRYPHEAGGTLTVPPPIDAAGRSLNGTVKLQTEMVEQYPGRFVSTVTFGDIAAAGAMGLDANRERAQFERGRKYEYLLQSFDANAAGLGGWDLSIHHWLDAAGGWVFRGDGTRQKVKTKTYVMERVHNGAGRDSNGNYATGNQQDLVNWQSLELGGDMLVEPNGDLLLVSSSSRIYRASSDLSRAPCAPGIQGPCIWRIGMNRINDGSPNYLPPDDGTPILARHATMSGAPVQMALAPDGSLFVAWSWGVLQFFEDNKVQPVTSEARWLVRKVAGTTSQPPDYYCPPLNGLDDLALNATSIGRVGGLAIGADGAVYVAASARQNASECSTYLLKIDTDGKLKKIIGGGSVELSPSNLPVNAPSLRSFTHSANMRLAIAPNGDLYFGGEYLYVMRGNGRVEALTNKLYNATPTEGVLSTIGNSLNGSMLDVKVAGDGSVFLGDIQLSGVRQIDPNGLIKTISGLVAGGVSAPLLNAPSVSARTVRFSSVSTSPDRIALAPNGDIYVLTGSGPMFRIHKPSDVLPCPNERIAVPSGDGSEIYCFDTAGRHWDTRDATACVNKNTATCPIKYSFEYEQEPDGTLSTRVFRVIDGAGNTTRITRSAGQIEIAPPIGAPSTLTLNQTTSYLAGVTDPAGQTWTVQMSDQGLLQRLVDPRQTYAHVFTYDDRGKLSTDGLEKSGKLESQQSLKTIDNADNSVVTDSTGLKSYVTKVTHTSAEGLDTAYFLQRDSSGKVTRKTTLPTGLVRASEESPDGITKVTEPDLVAHESKTYSDPWFGTDASLIEVKTTLPSSGASITTRRDHVIPDGGNTNTLTTSTGPAAAPHTTTVRWTGDPARTVEVISPVGRRSVSALDPQGRVLSTQDGDFSASSYHYGSALGALSVATLRGQSTLFDYEAEGDTRGYLHTVTSPTSTVTFSRNLLGLPTNQTTEGANLSSPIVTGYDWDAIGNMTSLTPPGRSSHAQTFTGFSQLKSYTAPEMSSVTSTATIFDYDRDRNLRRMTSPGRLPVEYVRNQGRLDYMVIGALQAGSTAIDFDYYAANETTNNASPGHLKTIIGPGALTTAAAPSASSFGATTPTLAYKYDGSLPLSEAYSGPFVGKVARNYDAYLNVATHSVTAGAGTSEVTSTVTYGTDADGVVTSASVTGTSAALSTVYDPLLNYRLTSAAVGATTESLEYDAYGTLASLGYTHGSANLFKAQYHTPRNGTADPAASRDALGRIYKAKDTWSDGSNHAYEYTYDGAGRLTRVTEGGTTVLERYSYDSNGNRFDELAGTTGTTYDEQDRLMSYAQSTASGVKYWSMTYGDDGSQSTLTNMGNGTTTRYTYDELGNLTKVVLNDGTVLDYIIDGNGRRIGKKRNGVLERGWLYDGQLRIVAELDGTGKLVSRFVYGTRSNIPDFMLKYSAGAVTGVYRIVADHLGGPRMVINVDSAKASDRLLEARYSAFGIPTVVSGSLSAIPFGFAGGLYDADTGLVRFGARDYDPRFGRWTHKDPTLFDGEQSNLYVYVENDPVNFVDLAGTNRGAAVLLGAAIGADLGWALGGGGGLLLGGAAGGVPALGTAPAGALGGAAVGAGLGALVGGAMYDTSQAMGNWLQGLMDDWMFAKGGRQNVRDSGLRDLTDEEVLRRYKEATGSDRKRYEKEMKGRRMKNQQKRGGCD